MFDGLTVVIDRAVARSYAGATFDAVAHAVAALGVDVPVREMGSARIDASVVDAPGAGVVVGPGSPYEDRERVLDLIRSARQQGVPLVGT